MDACLLFFEEHLTNFAIYLSTQQFSKVRSVRLDHWSHSQILKMLEGGNQQLDGFFARHSLSTRGGTKAAAVILDKRYRTKAAKFYRDGIQKHVDTVADTGLYRGRKVSRRLSEEKRQMMAQQSPEQQRSTTEVR